MKNQYKEFAKVATKLSHKYPYSLPEAYGLICEYIIKIKKYNCNFEFEEIDKYISEQRALNGI